jgi:DNA-binding response OmpR family regulator
MMSTRENSPRRPHVLIVEDDDGLVTLIKKQLTAHGSDCEHASTGQEALAILSQYTPTLMLLDFTLPDTTAEQLVAELQRKQLLPPFVMISGSEDAATAVSMMKLGARDYLVKDGNFLNLLVPHITRILTELDTEERLRVAEAALRESEERLRSTIASLDDLIYVLDKNGVFVDFYQPVRSAKLASPAPKFLNKAYWEAGFPAEMVKLLAKAMADIK